MTDEPRDPRPPRRRPRGRRRGGPARPQQAPAQPERPRGERPAPPRGERGVRGGRSERAPREERGLATRGERGSAPRAERGLAPRRTRRGGRGRGPRSADDVRPGTPCLILVDAREGDPDRSGQAAVFEGFFDFETGDPRRAGTGIARLRIGDERLWGFECWWRVDSERTGMTDADREDVEQSKRLLRGLLRDARRSTRLVR